MDMKLPHLVKHAFQKKVNWRKLEEAANSSQESHCRLFKQEQAGKNTNLPQVDQWW